jgi:hypothetical protein
MVSKCVVPKESVTALFTLCNAYAFRAKVDVERNERENNLHETIQNCLKLYLLFEHWVNEPHPWSQVCLSSKVIGNIINLTKDCPPRDEGWGWNLPKMHVFAKTPLNMLKFGSANEFSCNIGERTWKIIVEDHAEKTQMKPDKFSEQCVICEYESNVIKYVMTDILSQIGVSRHSSKNNNQMWESRGRYTIHFCKTNTRGVGIGEDKVLWHKRKREQMNF